MQDAILIFADMRDYAVPFSGRARSDVGANVVTAEGGPLSKRKAWGEAS